MTIKGREWSLSYQISDTANSWKLPGESVSRTRRKEESVIAVDVCLADSASYLNGPLHAITVRSTIMSC